MSYIYDRFSFPLGHQPHVIPQPSLHYSPYPPHPQQQLDPYYQPYPLQEHPDFPHGYMPEDYEDGPEVSTRPRLTKDQVDILEAQFQAHPKPNSNVKRGLAHQTKLTLPRVANWFQNRRAKAKQQRKQEEFEIKQGLGRAEGWKSDRSLPQEFTPPLHPNASPVAVSTANRPTTADAVIESSRPPSEKASPARDTAQEASWASLQRALHSARQQNAQDQEQALATMPPPDLHSQLVGQQPTIIPAQQSYPTSVATFSDWSALSAASPWVHTPQVEHSQFDFGFGQALHGQGEVHDPLLGSSPEIMSAQGYAVAESWIDTAPLEPVATPALPLQQSSPNRSPKRAQLPHVPVCPSTLSSRRQSTADLTANFGNFDLASNSPNLSPMPAPKPQEDPSKHDGELDIAARRKRPRPAALGTASLRSRSFGAPSMSPTFRNSSNPMHPNAVRHVKSTGHSLNARYAGVRKTSSAQRSPLNVGSFAEAEAFHQLMASRGVNSQVIESPLATPNPLLSPTTIASQHMLLQQNQMMGDELQITPISYQQMGHEQMQLTMVSPPATPFTQEYMYQSQVQSMMPPASATPQYASFPDYTPPYSAGPLTNSSWSDAPLTSPDMPSFPPTAHMPSMPYRMSTDMQFGPYSSLMLPPEFKDDRFLPNCDAKKTEFQIETFDGQKEQHAIVAKHMAQQKPKNYVFANATPSDF